MEEKVLIKGIFSDSKQLKKLARIYLIFGIVIGVILLLLSINMFRITELMSLVFTSAIFFLFGIYMMILAKITSKIGITVTDKRVFGKALFGKRVDLPIDMVSAVGMCLFNGIAVSTSSGTIKFLLCKNRDEVFDCISKVLLERQKAPQDKPAIITQEIPQSNADELKKYKDLLDSGIITEEEFNAKKKQLLGL